jgi:hypothetical protein
VKAIVQDRFGPPDVLRLSDTGLPEAGPDDVLVRVRAAALNPADWHILRGDPLVARLMGVGLTRPKARVAGICASRPAANHIESVAHVADLSAPAAPNLAGRIDQNNPVAARLWQPEMPRAKPWLSGLCLAPFDVWAHKLHMTCDVAAIGRGNHHQPLLVVWIGGFGRVNVIVRLEPPRPDWRLIHFRHGSGLRGAYRGWSGLWYRRNRQVQDMRPGILPEPSSDHSRELPSLHRLLPSVPDTCFGAGTSG